MHGGFTLFGCTLGIVCAWYTGMENTNYAHPSQCPDKETHAYIPDDGCCPTCGAYWADSDPSQLGQFLTLDD